MKHLSHSDLIENTRFINALPMIGGDREATGSNLSFEQMRFDEGGPDTVDETAEAREKSANLAEHCSARCNLAEEVTGIEDDPEAAEALRPDLTEIDNAAEAGIARAAERKATQQAQTLARVNEAIGLGPESAIEETASESGERRG